MSIKSIIEGKKEWRAYHARLKKLPKDFQIVYKEIQTYIFKVGPLSVTQEDFSILYEMIDLFEIGAADGKTVLEVTGPDVAAFADSLIGEEALYMDEWLASSRETVKKAMEKESGKD